MLDGNRECTHAAQANKNKQAARDYNVRADAIEKGIVSGADPSERNTRAGKVRTLRACALDCLLDAEGFQALADRDAAQRAKPTCPACVNGFPIRLSAAPCCGRTRG